MSYNFQDVYAMGDPYVDEFLGLGKKAREGRQKKAQDRQRAREVKSGIEQGMNPIDPATGKPMFAVSATEIQSKQADAAAQQQAAAAASQSTASNANPGAGVTTLNPLPTQQMSSGSYSPDPLPSDVANYDTPPVDNGNTGVDVKVKTPAKSNKTLIIAAIAIVVVIAALLYFKKKS